MAVQMIFCVETRKNADTDGIYLTEILKSRYVISNQVKISKIYMGTKSKYNSREVLNEIKQKTKDFIHGESHVVYCIDTDNYESNHEQKKEFEEIEKFCTQNGYELVWFCHDVEEVFLGRKVANSDKRKEAEAFRKNRMIEQVEEEQLMSKTRRKHTSNLLTVVDKYLDKKNS